MTDSRKLTVGSRLVLAFIMAGILVILSAWLYGRVTNPSLVVQGHEAPASPAMNSGDATIGRLMEEVGKNPMDGNALYHLAQHLVEAKRWEAAESFIERAVALQPSNPDWLHLLGVVKHSLQKDQEAAAVLERVLAVRDTPDVRYSLGVLYLHYLNEPAKGKAHLQAGLQTPDLKPDLKKLLDDALAQAPK